MRPLIGITCDVANDALTVNHAYVQVVNACGGLPLLLPCVSQDAERYAELCDGFILTGGDDPIMEHWGITTHPKAKPINPGRQEFELALLDALSEKPEKPALGVCLGMQLMGLHAGGTLDQHLPDTLATAAAHWGRVPHEVQGELGCGTVLSHHRQALTDAGSMRVVATAPDGVIEAIAAESASNGAQRAFYVGVQWHPERTDHAALGRGIIQRLIDSARCIRSE